MSVINALNHYNVIHAIIKNDYWGASDWFILCHKKQVRNTPILPSGTFIYEGQELFMINMARPDILLFHDHLRYGFYQEKLDDINGKIWEQSDQSFKSYVKSIKVTKVTIKVWKKY
jgi:hypothetical protein